MFATYLNKVTSFFRRHSHGKEVNPLRDWEILLGIGSAALLLFVGVSVFVFFQVAEGRFSQAPQQPVSIESIDRAKLGEILAQFAARDAAYQSARTSPPSLVDPRR